MQLARLYLRASTHEQDADRARADLIAFAKDRGLTIAATYTENVSGASLARPELSRLLSDCQPGDIILLEQVDRLSRLNSDDWTRLRAEIDVKGVKIVSLDLPTSWAMATSGSDEFTQRMNGAINALLLDVLAAVARKDYADRRRRQAQGILKARAEGKFKGRRENVERNTRIAKLLASGMSYSDVQGLTGAARGTVAKVAAKERQD